MNVTSPEEVETNKHLLTNVIMSYRYSVLYSVPPWAPFLRYELNYRRGSNAIATVQRWATIGSISTYHSFPWRCDGCHAHVSRRFDGLWLFQIFEARWVSKPTRTDIKGAPEYSGIGDAADWTLLTESTTKVKWTEWCNRLDPPVFSGCE